MRKTSKGYFRTDNEIYDNLDIDITVYALAVYGYLCRCGNQSRDAFPSYTTISKRCRISRQTAIRAIKGLETLGLITKDKREKRKSNLYLLSDIGSPSQIPPQTRITANKAINTNPETVHIDSAESEVVPERYRGSTSQEPKVVPDVDPKKNYLKRNNKKKGETPTTPGTFLIERDREHSSKETVSYTSRETSVDTLNEDTRESRWCSQCGYASDENNPMHFNPDGKPVCQRCREGQPPPDDTLEEYDWQEDPIQHQRCLECGTEDNITIEDGKPICSKCLTERGVVL